LAAFLAGMVKYCLAGGCISTITAARDKPPPTRLGMARMAPPGMTDISVSSAPRQAMSVSTTITPWRVLSDPRDIRWPSQVFAPASAPQVPAAPMVKAGPDQGLELVAFTMAATQSSPQIEAWRYKSARA